MRGFIISATLLFATLFSARAQDLSDPASLPSMRMIFNHRAVSAKGDVIHQATGTIDVQYPCYYIITGHLHFFGNDSVMYCKDIESNEVTISKSILMQLLKDADLKDLKEKATLSYTAKDGTRNVFTLSNAEIMQQKWPESHFQLTDDKMDDDTLVTDMR